MKKVIVLGSTGTAGLGIVKECLNRGHLVTAFTRRDDFPISHPMLKQVKGDAKNYDDVQAAIMG